MAVQFSDVEAYERYMPESAARLCDAIDAQIFRVDGDVRRLVASYGRLLPAREERPVRRGSVIGRAFLA